MDCSPPGSSVHGILQARILAWVAMPSSREIFPTRDWTHILCVSPAFQADSLPTGQPGKYCLYIMLLNAVYSIWTENRGDCTPYYEEQSSSDLWSRYYPTLVNKPIVFEAWTTVSIPSTCLCWTLQTIKHTLPSPWVSNTKHASHFSNSVWLRACVLSHFSCVWLFATLWTI